MFKKTLVIVLLFVSIIGFTQTIAYNQAGYLPSKPKRAIIQSDNSLSGVSWLIKDKLNQTVLSGSLSASLQGKTDYTAKAFNYQIDFDEITQEGTYSLEVTNLAPIVFQIDCAPYQSHIYEVLKTIRARRSGSSDALVHGLSHVGDTSCAVHRRGSENSNWSIANPKQTVDMYGGWYDAGDYIKFTLTSAYLCYHLLRAYEAYPELFKNNKTYSTTTWNDLLDEARHGLLFLEKTMPDDNTFIIQTGGYKDHNEKFRLPENDRLDGKRECYAAFSKPQMGLTAAALALGAQLFQNEGDVAFANRLQAKATQIYNKAKNSNESAAWWQGGGEVYYADDSEEDNMELAAIELYKLTNEASYLAEASSYGAAAGSGWWAAWSNVNMTAHSQLYPFDNSIESALKGDLNNFRSIGNANNNLWKAPHTSTWGTLYSYFGVANGALQYQQKTSKTTYEALALNVLDYTFGVNPWGLAFLASETLPNAITSTYAVMYRLQPTIFPTGEIAEGPTTLATHNENNAYFDPAHNPNLWHKEYNVTNFTFYEQPGDYVCMETTIGGLADGFYLLSLATGAYCENDCCLLTSSDKMRSETSYIFPNPTHDYLQLENELPWEITSSNGVVLQQGNSKTIDVSTLKSGIYFVKSNGSSVRFIKQ